MRRFGSTLSMLLIALALVSCRSAGPSQVRDAPAAGHLGHQLGTYLRIEGVRDVSGKSGDRMLRVDRVNGASLDPPQSIWLDNLPLPANVRCAISGYESGRWIGLPNEVATAEGMPQRQAAWQFHRFFIVTSVQAPPSLAAQFSRGLK